MGRPEDDEAKSSAEPATDVNIVPLDASDEIEEAPPSPPPPMRRSSRSIPPPIPPAERRRPTLQNIPVAQPSVVERAIAKLAETTDAMRAEQLAKEVEVSAMVEPAHAAILAYELGELYERRLDDEDRALASYRQAFHLDATLRPATWALRRVLQRRALWGDLAKLIDVELGQVAPAPAGDRERVELLLERAIVSGHAGAAADAHKALDEAVRLAPHDQGVLLELERVAARTADVPALLDAWDRLAGSVHQPERKIAYWLELARAAAERDFARARAVLDQAAQLAKGPLAARIARERLRLADEHGAPGDIEPALATLVELLRAGGEPHAPMQATAWRRELVALHRRQAQLARAAAPQRSWEHLGQAFALAPDEPVLIVDLLELAAEIGRHDDLPALVRTWQGLEDDAARALIVSSWCAEAHVAPARRASLRVLLRALAPAAPGYVLLAAAAESESLADPSHVRAQLDLAQTYIALARAAVLGTWLGPRSPPQPDAAAGAALYVQAAHLLAYHVATPAALDGAREALASALAAVPAHPAVLEALTELDDVTGRPQEALQRLRTSRGDRALLERGLRLAYSHQLPEARVELEDELVQLAPGDLALAWRHEATLAELGRDDERRELLARLARDDRDVARRRTAQLRAARLCERTGHATTLELYRALAATGDAFAHDSALELMRAQERWPELVAARRAEAAAASDATAIRRALREAAWVLEICLEDLAQAAAVYEEWLARVPQDRTALEGIARCRRALREPAREAAARAAIAEIDQNGESRWLYALSLERAGEDARAIEQYRAVASSEDASVATAGATLALGDLAARGNELPLRVEAVEALARRTSDARLGAALFEHAGWLHAIARDDLDHAAQSFTASLALEPKRQGALLGAALVAACQQQPVRQAEVFLELASSVQVPDVAAALLLRAAALASANGDSDVANERVEAARAAAPDDLTALLVDAEAGAPQRIEAADPFAAVDRLLARAELLARRAELTEDRAAKTTWELDRAEILEAAGQLREASEVVVAAFQRDPQDRRALVALRRLAQRTGNKAAYAQASFALAQVSRAAQSKLELLRDTLEVYDRSGPARNPEYALAICRRIVSIDPAAPERERLLELLREGGDPRTVIASLTEQLAALAAMAAPDELQIAGALLERASLLRSAGHRDRAIADLDAVLEHDPVNADALRLRADLAMDGKDPEAAVALWWRYLAIETSAPRRAEIEQLIARTTQKSGKRPTAPPPPPPRRRGRPTDAPTEVTVKQRPLAVPEAEKTETDMPAMRGDVFGSTTVVSDTSDLQAREREEARALLAHPDDYEIEVTGKGPAPNPVGFDTAIGAAVGAVGSDDLDSEPSPDARLRPPPLDLSELFPVGAPHTEQLPKLDPEAFQVPEEPALRDDDSAVVMLSYDQLQPMKADEASEDTLQYFEREIADAENPVALRLEAGRVAESLGELDRARAHYEAALLADRHTTVALRGLRRIARGQGDLEEVTRLVDAEIAVASPREREPLLHCRIDLLMAIGEHDIARVAVGAVLDGKPLDVPALLAHLELAYMDERTDELCAALEQLAEAVQDPELRAAAQSARAVLAAHQGDPAAAATWAAAAAAVLPDSASTRLGTIFHAVTRGEAEVAGAALLELACHVEGEDPVTASALAVRAQAWSATAAGGETARATIADAAQLAARAAPRDPLVARMSTETALDAGDRTIAGNAFARWARCKCAAAERAYAAARAAELDPGRLGRLWAQVLELDPGDDYAAARLRAAHVAAGETQLAIELDLRVAQETGRERPYARAAASWLAAGDVGGAIDVLEGARVQHPGSAALGEALAEALARAGRWTERAQVLGEMAASPGPWAADVARWSCALAWDQAVRGAREVGREELERMTKTALEAWDRAIADDPRAPVAHAAAIALANRLADPALQRDVLARAQAAERSPWAAASLALRRALLLSRSDLRLAQEVARDAASGIDDPRRTLELVLFAAMRREPGDAVGALEDRATVLDAANGNASIEAATLRLRGAQLALEAGDVARATLLLVRVDRTAHGLVDDLIDAAHRRREGTPPPAARPRGSAKTDSFVRVLRDADLAAARGEATIAVDLYQRALQIRPTDPLAAGPLGRLAAMVRDGNPLRALARELLRVADGLGDAGARAEAHELQSRAEAMQRPDSPSALRALEAACQADPSRLDLVIRLERHLAAVSKHGDLLKWREKELELLDATLEEDRVALLMDSATLALRDRAADARLAEIYRTVLVSASRNRRALFQLDSLLRRAGYSDELAALAEHIAGSFDDPRSKAAFLMRAGETIAGLGRPADAVQRFAKAVDVLPAYLPALEAWQRTALAHQLWFEVADASARKARLGGTPDAVAALHHFAGVALGDKASATEPAIEAFRRALEADPAHFDSFQRLRALYELSGRNDELAALLLRRLEIEPDRTAQVELHRTLAEHWANTGDRDKALQHYRALLRIVPADVRAHAAVADLVTDPRNQQAALDAVAARISLEKDPKILRSLHFRLGTMYAETDVPRALGAFQSALGYRPGDEASLVSIVDLAIGAGQWQLALESCDQLVTTQRDPDKLALYLHRAATIFARGVGDQARAQRMLQLAIEAAPTSTESLRLLVKFHDDAGDPAGLRSHLDQLANAMRARIAQDVKDAPAYRILARAAEPGHPAARAAAELAELLGTAGEPERQLIAEPPRPELARLVGPSADQALFLGTVQPELLYVLRLAGNAIVKHVGTDLGAYGVGRKDRLHAPDPTHLLVRDLALALGFKDVELYISSRYPYAMVAEPTHTVSLVLGSAILGDPARVRFAAGAALKLAQLSLAIPARLPVDELGAVVLAVLRQFKPQLPGTANQLEAAAALAPKLRKHLGSGVLEEMRGNALAVEAFSPLALARALKIAGLRAGLAASGTLLPGLAIVAASVGADLPSVLVDPVAQGLIAFAVGDHRTSASR